MNQQIVDKFRAYVENEFWPKHRELDQAMLLMLATDNGEWVDTEIHINSEAEGHERNMALARAARNVIAIRRPYAAAMISEARECTDDPHAHYDMVVAGLETAVGESLIFGWSLGLDTAAIDFLGASEGTAATFGRLYEAPDDDLVPVWIYLRQSDGKLKPFGTGGYSKSKPVSTKTIKTDMYKQLCKFTGQILNKKAVLRDLVVAFKPLL